MHPLDFLGGDDEPDLAFFPAMRMRGSEKTAFVSDVLAEFARQFRVVPMGEHARLLAEQPGLAIRGLPSASGLSAAIPLHQAAAAEQSAAIGG